MLIARAKCAGPAHADAKVVLTYGQRQTARLRAVTVSGEEIGILLPRGTVLGDDDLLLADDGRLVRVAAAAEALCEVACGDARELARAAYHLGNRHTPVEIGPGVLRFARDGVLADLMRRLGFVVREVTEAFHPEPGAYASQGAEHLARGVIHDHAHPLVGR